MWPTVRVHFLSLTLTLTLTLTLGRYDIIFVACCTSHVARRMLHSTFMSHVARRTSHAACRVLHTHTTHLSANLAQTLCGTSPQSFLSAACSAALHKAYGRERFSSRGL